MYSPAFKIHAAKGIVRGWVERRFYAHCCTGTTIREMSQGWETRRNMAAHVKKENRLQRR